MTNENWESEKRKFHLRMKEFGATPLFGLKNQDGSIFLVHANFDSYEGQFDKEPFLRLNLCTANVGHLRRVCANGLRLEGVIRPGSFGISLPNSEAEGLWPQSQTLAILVDPKHLSNIGEGNVSIEQLAPAASVLHRDPLVTTVMSAMARDAEAHGLTSAFFDHGLALILKRLAEYRHDNSPTKKSPVRTLSKAHLKRVLELIEIKLDSNLGVRILANECDQDVRSFTRAFRASTGYAPFEYLTLRRMERAKQYLLAGNTVTEVAFLVGYSNPSKFAAAFRRFCGCSPSQWRRHQAS